VIRSVQAIFLGVALLLLGGAVLYGVGGPGGAPRDEGAQILEPEPRSGEPPAATLVDRAGRPVALGDLRGRPVLLNFWATWCDPCKEELPHLTALARALKGKNVQLLLASVDPSFEPIEALAREFEKAAPTSEVPDLWRETAEMLRDKIENVRVVLDPDSKSARRYGTTKFPETYLLDAQGRLQTKFTGPKPWGRPAAIATLQGLLHL
jgi:cytochrome c biogenesis protein CcmG/thiol:disulfide interchange protein DsbE